jgi:glycosyltransferase involved in cell wall biosynthesis
MKRPLVNVTVPVFNEEETLAANTLKIIEFLKNDPRYDYEIVIANNGSTDKTQIVAEELARRHPMVRVSFLPKPGRGHALKTIWSESQADILSYMDVDLATDLAHFPQLIDPLIENRCDVAVGSRRLEKSVASRTFKRKFLSSCYMALVKTMFSTNISDAQCGFKTITRDAARQLLPLIEDGGWLLDTELLVLAETLGFRIFELPVRWVENADSRVNIGTDAVAAIAGLLRLHRKLRKVRKKFAGKGAMCVRKV